MEKKNILKTIFAALLLLPFGVSAASLSISSPAEQHSVGDVFTIKVIVKSDDSLNAISGKVNIPKDMFQIQSVSKAGSVLNFWVTEPSFSKSEGSFSFEGVSLSGFKGTGIVANVVVKAIGAGSSNISFQYAQILANDGQGTDITKGLIGQNFTVAEATVKEPVVEKAVTEKPIVEKTVVENKKVETKPEIKTVEEVTQISATLDAPLIVYGKRYNEDIIIGSSEYKKADTLITFISEGGTKIFITGNQSGDDGSFIVPVPNSLKYGAYKVNAVMIKKDGTYSQPSKEITIHVGNIFSDIDWRVRVAVLIIFIIVIILLLFRLTRYKKIISDDIYKTDHIIHKAFDILQEDMDDYVDNNKKSKLSILKADLKEAEKEIDKQIDVLNKDIKS